MHAAIPTPAEPTPLLVMQNIGKRFGAVHALKGVDLQLYPGEILALMGENGAGKSTLMKVLSGVYQADEGSILLDGKACQLKGPADAIAAGISIIHQEIKLSPNLTVAENLFLGAELKKGWRVDRAAMNREATQVLQRLSCSFAADSKVASLSIAEQQQVEIARALLRQCRVLVMDEPTAALSNRETEALFRVIRQLRDQGLAIVYISHRMAEIYALADRVSVLRDGTYIGTLEKQQIDAERLVQMMVGRPLTSLYQKSQPHAFGDTVLQIDGLTDGTDVAPCSLSLRAGEVVGLAGLVGSGRTELAKLIFGASKASAGSLSMQGRTMQFRHPQDAINAGIGYLTEDRKELGLFLDMSARDNMLLNVLPSFAWLGWLKHPRLNQRADECIDELKVKVAHRNVSAGSLSGGNQQKLLVARWMEIAPKVLILDEPTRGVDIGAKSEIYRAISELALRGVAVLMISSELPEILAMSDRVLVMRDGHIAGELPGNTTQEAIMALATAA
ncbi:D-ribose transporter ATP-binding protein [Pokkaliibacter plantistimulans]|uniref:D-ribose transporter ATP-binding protein n=1 Tax=Pokkaliibacter plantistimulans TaxID=1635171 RepID=A0ABX5M0Z5_9GAMM|nr:sugar ABC transporter ATP-binding protein [Pokkaliibacter plantistimulans]PXF32590.1 D-ribose transporter ATP-binding protein [Pokkaliibacter plantistimulans]